MRMSKFEIFKAAIMAGITIGIAGWGYLATYNKISIIGAVLFAFGHSGSQPSGIRRISFLMLLPNPKYTQQLGFISILK